MDIAATIAREGGEGEGGEEGGGEGLGGSLGWLFVSDNRRPVPGGGDGSGGGGEGEGEDGGGEGEGEGGGGGGGLGENGAGKSHLPQSKQSVPTVHLPRSSSFEPPAPCSLHVPS